MVPNPNPNVAEARKLGEALSRAEYTEDAIDDLLGQEAWSNALEDASAHNRRLPRDATGTAIRLFFLELPVPLAEAQRALGKRGIQALERTGRNQTKAGELLGMTRDQIHYRMEKFGLGKAAAGE